MKKQEAVEEREKQGRGCAAENEMDGKMDSNSRVLSGMDTYQFVGWAF